MPSFSSSPNGMASNSARTSGSRLLCSKRLSLALLCFAGSAIAYALRSNLSFAIVCMVKEDPNATVEAKAGCAIEEEAGSSSNVHLFNSTFLTANANASTGNPGNPGDPALLLPPPPLGEFEWSKAMQGQVLGAFFFGYLTSQMLGGLLAARIGPKVVLFASILASSLLSLLSPMAARSHVALFIGIRALLGFTQGVLFPAMHALWSGWAPPMERGILTGISYAGAQIGNVLVMPLSGLLCRHGFDGGWPSIFYILGVVGIVWCIVWLLSAADSPQKHRTIGEPERKYIMDSLGQTKEDAPKRRKIPLFAILRSKAVWAIFIGHFAGDWGAYTMALGLPSFLNDVLGMKLTSMGFISALPYIVYFVVINVGGHIADQLQQRHILSTLNTRRLAMIVALFGQAIFLVAIGYCGCGQDTLVIILLCASIGISGFQYAGFVVNYLDICPQLAGFVLGIGNTLSCLAGLVSPILMGWLTPNGTKEEWLLVFYVTAFMLIAGAIIFSALASAEVQPWARDDESAEGREMTTIEKPKGIEQKEPLLEEKRVVGDTAENGK